jgi:exodeoxyribonuclease VII large subunit
MTTRQMDFDFTAPVEAPADTPALPEKRVLTIAELNGLIRGQLEGAFPSLWIKGEISNFKAHTSGHLYFSLKDDTSQISAVMFRGFNSKLRFRPANGMEVLVKGKITVYEPRGNYQVFCEYMEPVGAGALQRKFEELKAKLEKEGLFSADRKRPLPAYPKHIAIVTSPTGAAIQDILNVLRRRYRGARITLAPTLVQGPGAAEQIVNAIQMVNRLQDVDVMIVGRGGGSIEDLWPFNEESVARAIAGSRIPTISAVGHEIDFTIADFVADLRAPTPSAAAELVVKNAGDLVDRILKDERRLSTAVTSALKMAIEKWRSASRRLIDPRRRLQDLILRNDELVTRLELAVGNLLNAARTRVLLARQRLGEPEHWINSRRQKVVLQVKDLATSIVALLQNRRLRLREAMAKLDALSPLKVVERGYSIVTTTSGVVVKSHQQIQVDEKIQIRFAEGQVTATVDEIKF